MDPRLTPLARALQAEAVPPVLALVSQDPVVLDEAESLVRSRLVEQTGAPSIDFTRIRVPPGTAGDALEPLLTVAMFASHELVVVHFDAKVDAKAMEALDGYLERPAPHKTLLLRAPEADRRARWYRQLAKQGQVFALASLDRRSLPKWLAGRARDQGWTLKPDAAALLVEAVGDEPRRLQAELDKVLCFVGPQRRVVERADIEACVTHTREEVVFKVATALARGDAATAALTLRNALEHAQNPVGLVGLVAHHNRLVAQVGELLRAGKSADAIAAELGRPPWQVRRLVDEARTATPRACEELAEWLADADRSLKSSRLDALLVLERIVVRAASAARKRRGTPRP